MKKPILLSFFFCCVLSLLLGQSKWNFSPSIIIGYSGEKSSHESSYENTISGDYYSLEEKKLMPSIGAGFTVERLLGNRFGLNLGVQYLYNQLLRRNEYSNSGPFNIRGSYYEAQRNLITHQIQTPFALHYYLGKPGGIRPYFGVGGQATYLISAVDYTESLNSFSGEINRENRVHKFDLKNKESGLIQLNTSINYAFGIEFNRLSIEFNRTQNTFKTNIHGSVYDHNCLCYMYLPEENTQVTTMSIKYKL